MGCGETNIGFTGANVAGYIVDGSFQSLDGLMIDLRLSSDGDPG